MKANEQNNVTTSKSEINAISLKALLLDTITVLKTGEHLAPNYKATKYAFCDMLGQKRSIKSKALLNAIGLVYKDNGQELKFWSVVDKFNARKFL